MENITRKEAKAKGLNRYFTGKRCKHGHVAQRYTRDAHCAECISVKWKSGRTDGKKYKPNSESVNVLPIPADDDTKLVDLSRLGFSTTGIDPEVKLTTKEWQSGLIALSKIDTGRQWCIGDLWNRKDCGTKSEYVESIGINPKSAQQYGWVCKVFPKDMRRSNLTFTHHREIASSELFQTDAEKIAALDTIEQNNLSARETANWMKKMKPTTTRVVVDPAVTDCRVVMKALKAANVVPGEVAKILRKAREILEGS